MSMSTSPAPTSQSSLLNLMHTIGRVPLAKAAGTFASNTAAAFEEACSEGPESRFAAIVVATTMTAFSILCVQFILGRVPIHFVKKTLIPVAEWNIKAGMAWVIFQACNATAQDVNRTPALPSSSLGESRGKSRLYSPPKRY